MTKEDVKKLLPVMNAFVDGKSIQYYDHNLKKWIDAFDPLFTEEIKYRIKPESKYCPFKSKKECWDEMLKHSPFGWVTDGDSNYNISVMDNSIVMVGDYDEYTWSRNYQHAFEAFKFIDGQPFGIKVDE